MSPLLLRPALINSGSRHLRSYTPTTNIISSSRGIMTRWTDFYVPPMAPGAGARGGGRCNHDNHPERIFQDEQKRWRRLAERQKTNTKISTALFCWKSAHLDVLARSRFLSIFFNTSHSGAIFTPLKSQRGVGQPFESPIFRQLSSVTSMQTDVTGHFQYAVFSQGAASRRWC